MPCPRGMFSFPGRRKCTPWLNFSQIALEVHLTKRFSLFYGVTKLMWRAKWKGQDVMFISCNEANARKKENCVSECE